MMRIHTGYTINASFRKCTVNCEDNNINVNNHYLFSRFLIFPRKVSRLIYDFMIIKQPKYYANSTISLLDNRLINELIAYKINAM